MKNKVIIALIVAVIIVGIIMGALLGFNKSFDYGYTSKIFINFIESFELADVENMAKEVFNGSKVKVEYIDEFEDGAVISVDKASEEQISTLEDKLIEKYEKFTEKDSGFMQVINVPEVRTLDLVKVFVLPVVIVTALVLIVFIIAFRKLGFINAFVLPVALIAGINALFVSIITICRIPMSIYIVASAVFVYVMSLFVTTIYLKHLKTK